MAPKGRVTDREDGMTDAMLHWMKKRRILRQRRRFVRPDRSEGHWLATLRMTDVAIDAALPSSPRDRIAIGCDIRSTTTLRQKDTTR